MSGRSEATQNELSDVVQDAGMPCNLREMPACQLIGTRYALYRFQRVRSAGFALFLLKESAGVLRYHAGANLRGSICLVRTGLQYLKRVRPMGVSV